MKVKTFKEIQIFDFYNPGKNHEVTSFYCDIIKDCIIENGCQFENVVQIKRNKLNKKRGILVVSLRDAIKAKMAGYKYVVTWVQGVAPEEEWLVSRNLYKFLKVYMEDLFGLFYSNLLFLCSEAMKQHYRKRFLVNKNKIFVMPCFNEEIHDELILSKDYAKNIFVYAGGIDRWQCFEKTVSIFKKIENEVPGVFLEAYVREKDEAKKILQAQNVNNYLVDYVSKNELTEKLKKAKFGFCIREDIEVNRVATPTKLSNYISNGIIPIISDCISDFFNKSKTNAYVLHINDGDFLEKVKFLCSSSIKNIELLNSYKCSFGNYYCRNFYKKKINEWIGKINEK